LSTFFSFLFFLFFFLYKSLRTNHVIVTVDACSLVICRIMIIDRVLYATIAFEEYSFPMSSCVFPPLCFVVLLYYYCSPVIRILSCASIASLSLSLSLSLPYYYYFLCLSMMIQIEISLFGITTTTISGNNSVLVFQSIL